MVVKETRTRQDNTRRRTLQCSNMHRFNTVERIENTPHGGDRYGQHSGSGQPLETKAADILLAALRLPGGET